METFRECPKKCTGIALKSHRNDLPDWKYWNFQRISQKCTKLLWKYLKNSERIALKSHRNCSEIAPKLLWNGSKKVRFQKKKSPILKIFRNFERMSQKNAPKLLWNGTEIALKWLEGRLEREEDFSSGVAYHSRALLLFSLPFSYFFAPNKTRQEPKHGRRR